MPKAEKLEDKSVKELRAIAKKAGIRGFSRMKKAELLAALKGAGKRAGTRGKISRKKVPTRVKAVGEAVTQRQVKAAEAQAAIPPSEEGETLPEYYGEDRIAFIPRDPEWAFIHWEVSQRLIENLGVRPSLAQLRVVYKGDSGENIGLEAQVSLSQGRYYARISVPGREACAVVGLLDEGGAFREVLRSPWVKTPAVSPGAGEPRFASVPPDQPLSEIHGARGFEGRLLTEAEYRSLFGQAAPGSSTLRK